MRPVDGIAAAAALLDRLTREPLPSWVSPRSVKLARQLVESLRADAGSIAHSTETEFARALGVSRTTLYHWRSDGWLRAPESGR